MGTKKNLGGIMNLLDYLAWHLFGYITNRVKKADALRKEKRQQAFIDFQKQRGKS
jgi:hypothetical protein